MIASKTKVACRWTKYNNSVCLQLSSACAMCMVFLHIDAWARVRLAVLMLSSATVGLAMHSLIMATTMDNNGSHLHLHTQQRPTFTQYIQHHLQYYASL